MGFRSFAADLLHLPGVESGAEPTTAAGDDDAQHARVGHGGENVGAEGSADGELGGGGDREATRVAGVGEFVVVQRVEVARGALILDEVGAGERPELAGLGAVTRRRGR
jgi:hypothetical protein